MAMLGSEQSAVHFPVSAEVPEHRRHLRLRTLLFQFLEHAFAAVAAVGSEQFVYWDPSDPRACLSPDAFLRFGYARLLDHRQPRYAAMARWGITVTAEEVALVKTPADFDDMIATALDRRQTNA